MEFRILLLILSLLASCSGVPQDQTKIVGETIGNAHSSNIISNLRPMIQMNDQFYYFDETSNHLQSININSKEHVASTKIDDPEKFINLIPGSTNNYFFKVFDRKVEVVDANLNLKATIPFTSTPLSYLYDETSNRLAIIAINFSVTLAQLDATGSLIEQWAGGPLIAGSTTITHGDFTDSGDIILVTDATNLVQVDFEGSMVDNSWQTENLSLEQEFTDISWFTIYNNNAVIIAKNIESDAYDAETLSVLNLETNTITNTKNMGEVLARFLVKSPHLYYKESSSDSEVRALRVDDLGDIIDIPVHESAENICYSDIDLEQGVANVVLCQDSRDFYYDVTNTYMRVRLTDLFTLAEKEIPSNSKIGIDSNHLMITLPFALGYSEIFRFTDQEDFVIKGYNIDNL